MNREQGTVELHDPNVNTQAEIYAQIRDSALADARAIWHHAIRDYVMAQCAKTVPIKTIYAMDKALKSKGTA